MDNGWRWLLAWFYWWYSLSIGCIFVYRIHTMWCVRNFISHGNGDETDWVNFSAISVAFTLNYTVIPLVILVIVYIVVVSFIVIIIPVSTIKFSSCFFSAGLECVIKYNMIRVKHEISLVCEKGIRIYGIIWWRL